MDIRTKRAQYIEKNNEIMQEFHFSHPKTKMEINSIYNNHFTGSPLWNLFSRDSEMLFNTWNKSVRLIFDVPLTTHRFFLEPLADSRHLKNILMKRFLGFIQQIEKSPKLLPNILLQAVKRDCRSTTGSNLRNIMLLTTKDDITKLVPSDALETLYQPVLGESEWKVDMLMELIDVKHGQSEVENLSATEVEDILQYICTS